VTRAFRIIDGVMTEVRYQGEAFYEIVDRGPPRWLLEPAEYQVSVGIYRVDLVREQSRSGVPYWWRRNLSRRRRCATWAAASPAQRERARSREIPPLLGHRRVVGHLRHEPWTGTDMVLYLPAGEAPTEEQGRQMERTARGCPGLVHLARELWDGCEWGAPGGAPDPQYTTKLESVRCPLCQAFLARYEAWRKADKGAPLPLP
jgi:hypothetical protein